VGLSEWDMRYLEMAELVAGWTKDPRAGVGAVIAKNNRVIAAGFNGFPTDVLDHQERLTDKDTKLAMVVHAEENALIVAGKDAEGATIYVFGKPVCPRCAGSIIQARIKRVVAARPETEKSKQGTWDELGVITLDMFAEAGIKFHSPAVICETLAKSGSLKKSSASKSRRINGKSRNGASNSTPPAPA